MSFMVHREDTCHTASDVRTAAIRVFKRRQASRPKRESWLMELVKAAEFMPPPSIVPEIFLEPLPPPDPAPYKIKIIDIQRAVCRQFNVRLIDLLSARRDQKIVVPRFVSFVLCRLLTVRSYPEIGRRTGGRDHTTVLHGKEKYQWLYEKLDAELSEYEPLSRWVSRAHELVTH